MCTVTRRRRFSRPCRDTCWSVGSTAHIKSFIGAFWSFSLSDDAICKDFVEAVRLGISACLTSSIGSGDGNSSSASLFQVEQPAALPMQRADSVGIVEGDDFALTTLGNSAGINSNPVTPASKFRAHFINISSCFMPVTASSDAAW